MMVYNYNDDTYTREELENLAAQEFAAIKDGGTFDFDEWLDEAISWGHVEVIEND